MSQESEGPSTWVLFFAICVVWFAISLYSNERVLAPDVMAGVVRRANGVQISASQLDQLQRQGRWAYVLLPMLLAVRIGVVALVLQLASMLLTHALPYRNAYRASLWGFGATAYGTLVRLIRLDLLPPDALTQAELALVPDSLAAVLPGANEAVPFVSASLGVLSLHDLFWVLIVTVALTTTPRLHHRQALAIATGTWCATALARVGGQVLMMGLIG
jgi:hypothetical protein